ncbi:protein IMPACT-A-like isoform X2 [Corticium candelabrum]|uniref:protein IMPACT-A-like isoform X2 n=1 Tax=Corticium candelabrum TaxID=121492 RepID=UPI002E272A7F|nr:protein IMPACT-A-like isoform X2 [Corticium candelabrum]
MSSTKQKQADELEVLSSIYGEDWKTVDIDNQIFKIDIAEETNQRTDKRNIVTLQVVLPFDYPGSSPPMYELIAPWMSEDDVARLASQFELIARDSHGEVVIYQWIECVREHLNSLLHDGKCETVAEAALEHCLSPDDGFKVALRASTELLDSASLCQFIPEQTVECGDQVGCPEIAHGEPVVDRKSTFQAHLATVTSKLEVSEVLQCLMKNRKIINATHNVMAYRIYDEVGKRWYQHCDDDGESPAGGRLLHLLQILKVQNVVVIASRWYGGIRLGPDRFKHYNNCVRNLLQACGYLDDKPDQRKKSARKVKVSKKR